MRSFIQRHSCWRAVLVRSMSADRLRAIGGALARLVRVDEHALACASPMQCCVEQRVDAIGVGALGVVDQRRRRDAERLQLLGRQRRRPRRHGRARQLALELGVGAGGLLLERGGAIDEHDLGRANAAERRAQARDREATMRLMVLRPPAGARNGASSSVDERAHGNAAQLVDADEPRQAAEGDLGVGEAVVEGEAHVIGIAERRARGARG